MDKDAATIPSRETGGQGKVAETDLRLGQFVAILEFGHPGHGPELAVERLETLLGRLCQYQPIALFNPDLYSCQLTTWGTSAAAALQDAIAIHGRHVEDLEFAHWTLLRAEIVTKQEFDAEQLRQGSYASSWPSESKASSSRGCVPRLVHQATREMILARTPLQISNALLKYVTAAGGKLVTDADRAEWCLPLDLSLGEGEPVFASAPAVSTERIVLEDYLPDLHHDARFLCLNLLKSRVS